MQTIKFWFEFASTYSYLSVSRVEHLTMSKGIPVEWKVFLLGPVFKNQGRNTSPFNIYRAKGLYMWRDLERLCQKYVLPSKKPTVFPRNGLLAARVACLASSEVRCPDFVRAVFRANFVEDRDISDPTVIEEIFRSLGQNGQSVIQESQPPKNKERLKCQTEEAQKLGIFGAPSFMVGNELFWGNDRLEDTIEWYKNNWKRNYV
ncbi:MAG: 2-hydroxychromene-2-carboxylate isomerase [Deltaproteobacteria bacterium]|nr:2-hydroxychromene-2-carboxylate isomerase [Deltaproteobacteria bacterium]